MEAGELPRAFIVRKPGTHVEAKDIHAFINGNTCIVLVNEGYAYQILVNMKITQTLSVFAHVFFKSA